MTKKCPKCGLEVPDDAHFCGDCGYNFMVKSDSPSTQRNNDGIFSNGKIFLVLIAIIAIVGIAVILSFGFGGDDSGQPGDVDDGIEHVSLTITDVNGYAGSSSKSYTLYTEAIFTKVPSDLKGYLVKTVYFDKNGTQIGQETETLDNVYYDSEYSLSFGHYTTYKKPNPDYVNVEIIYDGKTIDNFTSTIDQGKIEFLN